MDKIHFFLHYEILIDDPKHIGDIKNHIIRDILKQETELVIIKSSPKASSMFIERICPIGFKIILIGLDIISDQIGAITSFKDFTTNKTFYGYNRFSIKPDLNIISRFRSAQLRLCREIQIHKLFDKKIFISIDDKSLIRNFKRI